MGDLSDHKVFLSAIDQAFKSYSDAGNVYGLGDDILDKIVCLDEDALVGFLPDESSTAVKKFWKEAYRSANFNREKKFLRTTDPNDPIDRKVLSKIVKVVKPDRKERSMAHMMRLNLKDCNKRYRRRRLAHHPRFSTLIRELTEAGVELK